MLIVETLHLIKSKKGFDLAASFCLNEASHIFVLTRDDLTDIEHHHIYVLSAEMEKTSSLYPLISMRTFLNLFVCAKKTITWM